MAIERHLQKKANSQSAPTSAPSLFQPRPFAVQARMEPSPPTPETPQLQTQQETTPSESANKTYGEGQTRLSRMQISPLLPIQPKLTIGAPGDKYEQEADRVADTVMRMPALSAPTPVKNPTPQTPLAQAKPIAAAITPVPSFAQMQSEPLASAIEEEQGEAKKGRIQPRMKVQAAGDGTLRAPSSLETQLNQSKNSGSPLSPQIRSHMEPRFGADFSGVRVHTDAAAVQMNRDLGAQAFTHGNHIYYGAGKSPGNNHLTAHELTHTIQQSGSSVIQRYTNNNVSTLESEQASQQAKQREEHRQTLRAGNLRNVQAQIKNSSISDQHHRWGWEIRNNAMKDKPLSHSHVEMFSAANFATAIVWACKDFYWQVRDSIITADLTKAEGITTASSKVLEILKRLYSAQSELDRALGIVQTTWWNNWDNTRWALWEATKEVEWQIGEYENHYRVLNNCQTSSKEIKYLATRKTINSVLLGQVASALESLVPMNGSATVKLNLKIPIKEIFFVGIQLQIEAERKENQIKLRVEALLEGGVRFKEVSEFKGSVGLYSEAQADTLYNAIKLISYGLYKKALASSVVPNSVAYELWSGESDEYNAKRTLEEWENGIESNIFKKVKDSYVDTGDAVKATASHLILEGSYKYTSGTKHTAIGNGESTAKHVVELKLSAADLGQIGIKTSIDHEEAEAEISFRSERFSDPLKAVIAFSDALAPYIKKLEDKPKFSDTANSLNNIRIAFNNIKDAAIAAPQKEGYLNSQSVKFSLSFTQNRSQSGFKITKGSLKIMRMDNMGGERRSNHPKPSSDFSLEYEKAARFIELSYANGKWKLEF